MTRDRHGWYEKNKEITIARAKKWAKDNPERVKKLKEEWAKRNKQKLREYEKEYFSRPIPKEKKRIRALNYHARLRG